jgi:hypothetical protein
MRVLGRHRWLPVSLCLAFVAMAAGTGCDRTVSKEETTVKKSDGSVTKQEKEVTQSRDGKVTEKTTEKTNNP